MMAGEVPARMWERQGSYRVEKGDRIRIWGNWSQTNQFTNVTVLYLFIVWDKLGFSDIQADFLVGNLRDPRCPEKGPPCVVMQTWHGSTPGSSIYLGMWQWHLHCGSSAQRHVPTAHLGQHQEVISSVRDLFDSRYFLKSCHLTWMIYIGTV